MELRPYQSAALLKITQSYKRGSRAPLFVLPTGGGKTIIITALAAELRKLGKRVLILVHRQELIRQTSDKLCKAGQRHGIIWGKAPVSRDQVQVASVQTLRRRTHLYEHFDFIIIDEAHHAPASTYQYICKQYSKALLLGVTATPERTDGTGLNTVFDDLVLGPTIGDLQSHGYLVKTRVYAPPLEYSVGGLPRRGGDFVRELLALEVDRPSITGSALSQYQKHCNGKKGIAFCVSVDHARHVASQFDICGIRAEAIDGGMPDAQRQRALDDFAAGRTLILTSCDLVSEGFDVPDAGVAILLRPTESRGLHRQQIGRILRPAAGKSFGYILDHAGNCFRHGLPDYEPEWSLEGRAKRGAAEESAPPPTKTCPRCFSVFGPRPVCPDCGHVFARKEREIDRNEGELELVTDEVAEIFNQYQNEKERAIKELTKSAERKGLRYPALWAEHIYKARHE